MIPIETLITHVMPLTEINAGFALMQKGESIRSLVVFEANPARKRRMAKINPLLVDGALLRITGPNWGVAESGRLARSNLLLPREMAKTAKRHGIRSVVNLRGHRVTCGSGALGRQVTYAPGVVQADQPLEN